MALPAWALGAVHARSIAVDDVTSNCAEALETGGGATSYRFDAEAGPHGPTSWWTSMALTRNE